MHASPSDQSDVLAALTILNSPSAVNVIVRYLNLFIAYAYCNSCASCVAGNAASGAQWITFMNLKMTAYAANWQSTIFPAFCCCPPLLLYFNLV